MSKNQMLERHPIAFLLLFPLSLTVKCVLFLPVTLLLYAIIIPALLVVGIIRLVSRLDRHSASGPASARGSLTAPGQFAPRAPRRTAADFRAESEASQLTYNAAREGEARAFAWKPAGQVVTDRAGRLEFPPVPSVHGLYWFTVAEGTRIVAGYVGKAGGVWSLAQRFGNYKSRAVSPMDQHGKAVPLAARDDQLGTASLNARRMLRALGAGQTVSIFIIDDPALADDALLNKLETNLIGQLCRSGVIVWNRAGARQEQ